MESQARSMLAGLLGFMSTYPGLGLLGLIKLPYALALFTGQPGARRGRSAAE